MEFLPLSRRRSSARNIPSGEERGQTDVFAGYSDACGPTYISHRIGQIHGSVTYDYNYQNLSFFLALLTAITLFPPWDCKM